MIDARIFASHEQVHEAAKQVTDRTAIQSVLQQVQAGEITPQQATERLIAAENAETLQSLIDRLGTPPDDIIYAWCDQLRLIASTHEANTGQPLPEIELSDWAITADGDLLLHGQRFRTSDYAPRASQESLDRILDFQRRWIPDGQVSRPATSDAIAGQFPAKKSPAGVDSDKPSPSAESKPNPVTSAQRTRAMMIAGIAACAVGAALILFRASRPASDEVADNTAPPARQSPAVAAAQANVDIDAPTTESIGSEPPGELETLETFQPTGDLEMDPGLEEELSMSLDGLMPSLEDDLGKNLSQLEPDESPSTPSLPETTDPGTNEVEGDQSAAELSEPTELSGPTEGQIADEEPIPKESPQQIRESPVASVQLPDPGDVETNVRLADRPLSEIEISFPYDLPVTVEQQNDDWLIRDTRKEVPLAVIRSSDGGTELSWSKTAKQSPAVSALAHGRLTDTSGSSIYLRPQVESDPWSFKFEKTDVMPTWNLGNNVPPSVSNLKVQFQLPDDIEYGWVDPIDPGEVRRGRGTAVINIAGDEDVALAIRFDIRCTSKLAVRMRFAARLDPSMSWQIVSTPLLAQFSNQLTERASMISHESERLAKVYRSLDRRDAKRYIRNKQDHVKDLAKQTETAAKRVAKLQSLIARLETEASIGFRVWVDWPDAEQTLLSAMTSD